MKGKPKRKMPIDPLARIVYRREMSIRKMENNIVRIRQRAEEDVHAVERKIAAKKVLLSAIKKGVLKVSDLYA